MIRVRTLLLALWAMQCLASHAGLIDQVGVELRLDDNLARAELDGDITSDSTLEVSADAGAGYQVSDSDRLKLSFELSASAFRRYDGLDHVAARVALTHRHKFGLGAYAPALALAVSASRLIYRDSARTGWQYEAGATLHKRFRRAWTYRPVMDSSCAARTTSASGCCRRSRPTSSTPAAAI